MNIERSKTIDGWIGDDEMEYLAQSAAKSKVIAEIGSWKGRSTSAMADNTTGKIYAVDTWAGSPEHTEILRDKDSDWLFNEFKKNMAGLNVEPIRMTSLDAAKYFAEQEIKFDLIFIDANHDFAAVNADILAWRPLLNENGILCGHDFVSGWFGVIQAVQKNISSFRVISTLWTTEV
jgi:predicted O-methyltransferase YrrM